MLTALSYEKEQENEWINLILEARKLGIAIDEIRDFLQQSSKT